MAKHFDSWRACYLHPKKPAVRDCASCGKPICSQCARESGDLGLCVSCKESALPEEKQEQAPAEPRISLPTIPQPSRKEALRGVGEVTVLRDGKVVDSTPADETEVKSQDAAPAQETPEKEKSDTASAGTDTVTEAALKDTLEKLAGPSPRRVPAEAGLWKRNLPHLRKAFPYSVAVGIGVSLFWLGFCLLSKNWTQISVLTLGIVIPWVMVRGDIKKKRLGEQAPEKPTPLLISSMSVAIMLVLVPVVEYLASVITSRGNGLENTIQNFRMMYLTNLDILILTLGFVAAFVLPLVVNLGRDFKTSLDSIKTTLFGKK